MILIIIICWCICFGGWWPFQVGHHEMNIFEFRIQLVPLVQVNWDELATSPYKTKLFFLDVWEERSYAIIPSSLRRQGGSCRPAILQNFDKIVFIILIQTTQTTNGLRRLNLGDLNDRQLIKSLDSHVSLTQTIRETCLIQTQQYSNDLCLWVVCG